MEVCSLSMDRKCFIVPHCLVTSATGMFSALCRGVMTFSVQLMDCSKHTPRVFVGNIGWILFRNVCK